MEKEAQEVEQRSERVNQMMNEAKLMAEALPDKFGKRRSMPAILPTTRSTPAMS